MHICGLNKTTLLDYPGKVACVIFLGGCNFRCPFCQNSSLVLSPQSQPALSEEDILSFLKRRRGILDGVCITGGEPTLSPQLPRFLEKIRSLGYFVKLDTNGSHPDMIKALAEQGLINMVAMDIKNSPPKYAETCGLSYIDMKSIDTSIDFLISGSLEYEFRTTVVKELHDENDFRLIGQWLTNASRYYLQSYRDSDTVICPGYHSCTFEELTSYRKILSLTIPHTAIRGVD